MNKSNNIVFGILLSVVVILFISSISLVVYNNFHNTNNTLQNNIKQIDINSEEVKNLIYPTYNRNTIPYWEYKDITIENLGLLNMVRDSIKALEPTSTDNKNNIKYYSASKIQENFHKIFGPDTIFTNYDIIGEETCEGATYNNEDNTYSISECNNTTENNNWDYIVKLYKAEQDDKNIYVYYYVQPYYCSDELGCYLFDRQTNGILNAGGEVVGYTKKFDDKVTKQQIEEEVNKMINNEQVDTYKFTFKKQSDNKYYFYSGEW